MKRFIGLVVASALLFSTGQAFTCSTEELSTQCAAECDVSSACEEAAAAIEDEFNPEDNLAIAFAMVTAAGLSTTFGAALVFHERFVRLANKRVLGGSLGFSAGVMLYVSMIEIFNKGLLGFQECDCLWDSDGAPYVMTTVCFFCGIIVTMSLNKLVHWITARKGDDGAAACPHEAYEEHLGGGAEGMENSVFEIHPEEHAVAADGGGVLPKSSETFDEHALVDSQQDSHNNDAEKSLPASSSSSDASIDPEQAEKKRLSHMGLMTAIAIGLHNFPEGLATFVAALADPAVGAALAVAIAIHNVPEGMCVAIPIYYATGSRWKGFWLAFWSGVTEVIGAALGYAFLMSVLGPAGYATLFALVSGMMIGIVVKELLPTAHRYDPTDSIVSPMVFLGMAVMALSLTLFVV